LRRSLKPRSPWGCGRLGEEAAGMPRRAVQAPRQRCGPRRDGVKRP
jgi:hypothetical protein